MRSVIFSTSFLFTLLFLGSCQSNSTQSKTVGNQESAQLGELSFEVTGKEVAQPSFKCLGLRACWEFILWTKKGLFRSVKTNF